MYTLKDKESMGVSMNLYMTFEKMKALKQLIFGDTKTRLWIIFPMFLDLQIFKNCYFC